MAPLLVHFVIHCHPTVDYDVLPVARAIFGPNKCIVAKHVDAKDHHWHLHGESVYGTMSLVKDDIRRLLKNHPAYKDNPKARPWITNNPLKTNQYGYQYVLHEGVERVVFSQGFTDEELKELASLSDAAVAEKKAGVVNHLKRKFITRPCDDEGARTVHFALAQEASKYLRAEKAEHIVPANVRNQVFTFFHQAPWVTEEDKMYLSNFFN